MLKAEPGHFMRRREIKRGILGLILFLGIGGGLWFAYTEPDELRLRGLILEARAAVESEDLERAITLVSEDYWDERGWTYYLIRRLLRDAFAQFDHFEFEMDSPGIEVNGKEAHVAFDLRLFVRMKNQRGLLLGSLDEPAHLELVLTRVKRQWLVTGIKRFPPRLAGQ